MDINFVALLFAMVLLFVVGMAIFVVWELLEPKREGESRSLVELVMKPAPVMAGGVAFLGICMVFPLVLLWTFGVLALFTVVEYFRMPASQKAAIARTFEKPDPTSLWSTARLTLAVVLVFATVAGLWAIFAPQ